MNDCKNYEQKKKTLVCECKSKKFYKHSDNHKSTFDLENYLFGEIDESKNTLLSCVKCGKQYEVNLNEYIFEKNYMVCIKNGIKDVDAVVLKFE